MYSKVGSLGENDVLIFHRQKIIVDLSPYHNYKTSTVMIYPVALPTAKIGDTYDPGFTVTSAKLIANYSGTTSKEIAKIKPVAGTPSDSDSSDNSNSGSGFPPLTSPSSSNSSDKEKEEKVKTEKRRHLMTLRRLRKAQRLTLI